MSVKRKRGENYPIEYIASELGVDRMALRRRLEDVGIRNNGSGITFREAYRALTNRGEEEEEARRTKRAIRESAEIEAAKKKGMFVLKRNHERVVADLAVQTRVEVERATYIPHEVKKKLSARLAAIRVELARPEE